MAATASPSMAKSMKSTRACSLNRSRSGPSTGGRPRDRTASARARKRSTMAWGSNSSGMTRWYRPLPVRHDWGTPHYTGRIGDR